MEIKTPFEYLDNILLKKGYIEDDAIHNKYARLAIYFLSHHDKFIHIVNDLNKYHYNPRQIYDILYYLLPARKPYIKYPKKSKINESNIKTVQEYYQCKKKDAIEYLKLLERSDIIMMERINKNEHEIERY